MSRTLSEAESKAILAPLGVPFPAEILVVDPSGAPAAAEQVGFPVAMKLCGDNIAHKTERGLVRLGISDGTTAMSAAQELIGAALPEDDAIGVLVAPMITGTRELIAGASHDDQFGPTVLVGIGGVLTEALGDVAVRLAPISRLDAEEMIEQIRSQALLGEVRGEPPLDRDALVEVLLALSQAIGDDIADGAVVSSIDINPMIIGSDGRPIAVDALVEVSPAPPRADHPEASP